MTNRLFWLSFRTKREIFRRLKPSDARIPLSFLRGCVAYMIIRPAVNDEDWTQVKSLFREYFEWVRSEQGIDLGFQNIEAELGSLPGAFSPPGGCLFLAEISSRLAGCADLRPLEAGTCEMKRMYVRPGYRGKGVGRALGGRIIQEARHMGYQLMRLDTADTMEAAQSLYASLGFIRTQPYYALPSEILQRAVFMELVYTAVKRSRQDRSQAYHQQQGTPWEAPNSTAHRTQDTTVSYFFL